MLFYISESPGQMGQPEMDIAGFDIGRSLEKVRISKCLTDSFSFLFCDLFLFIRKDALLFSNILLFIREDALLFSNFLLSYCPNCDDSR